MFHKMYVIWCLSYCQYSEVGINVYGITSIWKDKGSQAICLLSCFSKGWVLYFDRFMTRNMMLVYIAVISRILQEKRKSGRPNLSLWKNRVTLPALGTCCYQFQLSTWLHNKLLTIFFIDDDVSSYISYIEANHCDCMQHPLLMKYLCG